MDNPGITKEAVAVLLSHTWPGNVRELANTIQKGLIFNRGAPIQPQEILQAVGAGIASGAGASLRETDQVLRQWARETISSRNEANKFDAIMDHSRASWSERH